MNELAENKKFIATAELKNIGYSYYKISKLEKDGLLRHVNRSTYENLSYKGEVCFIKKLFSDRSKNGILIFVYKML